MKVHGETIRRLVFKNIRQRKNRSVFLICIVALSVFVALSGSILVSGIQNGLHSAVKRMGAELLVAPKGCGEEVQGLLLRSEQNAFYFSDDVLNEVEELGYIDKITSQLFIQSMDASCCSVPVQLIAYDPATDFVVYPWIYESSNKDAGFMDAVVGSFIEAEPGDQILLFGQELSVTAKLDETATGFDSSIFMTRDTADVLIDNSGDYAEEKLDITPESISCILINSKNNISAKELGKLIETEIPDVDVIISDSMFGDISARVNGTADLIFAVVVLIWIMSTMIVVFIFIFSVNERAKEFGIYRVLGFSRKAIQSVLTGEIFTICFSGWVFSAFVCSMIFFPFKSLISVAMRIPYLMPGATEVILYYLLSLLLMIFTGGAACLVSLHRISGEEVLCLIKEDN